MHGGHGERPRELTWYHAAGMLFGDWGTSRLYVLGLAFVMSGHASFWFVAAMCVLVSLVGFAYTIVCAHFPDGGGVYSAAKQRSTTLAVIGALLLFADYTITAALSAYEGFRYILPSHWNSRIALYLAVVSILLIGAINIFGPRRAGIVALWVGIASALFYLILGGACLGHLQGARIEASREPYGVQWSQFVNVILALSGVEAIANMTGIMRPPVAGNARKAIFIVLAEVVVLNLLMAYAMNAMPRLMDVDVTALDPHLREDYRDHMVKILASEYVGEGFAAVASVVFGLLLLSAANTAIGGMVSIQFLLSRDGELPKRFTGLNRFGMPWWGLIVATAVPAVVLLVVGNNTEMLAGLYAIGVVGAIAINLCACGTNAKLALKGWERFTLLAVGAIVVLIELTIAYEKPSALLFALLVLGAGLLARTAAKRQVSRLTPAAVPAESASVMDIVGVRPMIEPGMPYVLMPTRGSPKLLKFGAQYAKDKHAALFVLFVREVVLQFRERDTFQPGAAAALLDDAEARRIFAEAKDLCEAEGVPMVPIYTVHDSAGEVILDHAATLGAHTVLMGVSQRGAMWRAMRGDVLQDVAANMPEDTLLLIHA